MTMENSHLPSLSIRTDLSDVVVWLWLPAEDLVKFDHDTRLAVIHSKLLWLAALNISVVSDPLDGSHGTPEQQCDILS